MIPLNNKLFNLIATGRLIRKKKFDIIQNLNHFKKSQYFSFKKLKEIQNQKLRQLIKYSYDYVTYYHELFKNNNLHPNDIRSINDLKKIPILTKKEIRENHEKLISKNKTISNLHKNYSGGSTSEPVIFYQCKNYLNWAAAGRIFAWYVVPGFDYGTRTAVLWGAERDIRSVQPFFYQLRKYYNGLITMNSFITTDDKFKLFTKRMNQFKPFILRGYASSIFSYANFIDKNKIKIPNLSCVISSAEVLYEHQRKKLEEVFGCHVLNSYGCREVSQIAMECKEHNGLHVMMENQIVEILDSNEDVAPNEVGDVIVTNLNNYGMPLIRYRVEDMARQSSLEKCNCNRGLSLIDNITGRVGDRLITPLGNYIHAEYFWYNFLKNPDVKEYQIIQEKKDKIIILIVGDSNILKNKLEILRNKMIDELGEGIKIEIKFVDHIEKSKTGKYQSVISKIK